MLKVQIDFTSIHRPVASISLKKFAIVTVVPGTILDIVRITPENDTFYLNLPAMHLGKPWNAQPSLLHAHAQSESWMRALRARLSYQRPPGAACGQCILQVMVFEAVSDSVPESVPTNTSDANKHIGVTELAMLRKLDAMPADAERVLSLDKAATTRIGSAKFGVSELLKLYEAPTTQPHTLFDLSCENHVRGEINIVFSRAEVVGGVKTPVINAATLQGSGTFTDASWRELHVSAEAAKVAFVKSYLKMFPALKGEGGFVNTQGSPLSAISYQHGSTPASLTTSAPITRYHAPTAYVDGNCPIPFGFYYYRPVPDAFLSQHHETYLVSVVETLCYHHGVSKEALASSIHGFLDRVADIGPGGDFLASVRLFSAILTFHTATFRYRTDMALGDGANQPNIVFKEDIATDLEMGLNSDDCDGLDKFAHYIFYVLWTGRDDANSASPWKSRDEVYSAAQQKKTFGGWNDIALDALQRLCFYYCPMSAVGVATEARAGLDDGAVGFDSISDFDSLPSSVQAKLNLTPRGMAASDVVGHRWSIMMPLGQVTNSLVKCFQIEDANGTVRYSSDQELVNKVVSFDSALKSRVDLAAWSRLPTVTLESTLPTNPFCVVGASHWCSSSSAQQGELLGLETKNRQFNYDRKRLGSHVISHQRWAEKGVSGTDEGSLQLLPGDSQARKSGSSFYKMVTHVNIPSLGELFSTPEFTCAVLGSASAGRLEFGVDVEELFVTPAKPASFLIAMSSHRIPISERKTANSIGEMMHGWLAPNQCFFYNRAQVDFDSGAVPRSSESLSAFRRQIIVLASDVISTDGRAELLERIQATYGDVRITRQKMFPYGGVTEIVSFNRPA